MFIRKLTDEEIERIKKSKDDANKIIKAQRKKLQAEIKTYQKTTHFNKLNLLIKQLDKLSVITESPVLVKVEGVSLCINYDLLKKFERALYKSNLRCSDIKIDGKSLMIRYGKHGQSGAVELFELPEHQVKLLTVLPTINLKE